MIGFLTSESGSGVFRSQAPVRVCSLPVQKPTTLLLSETTHDRNGAVRRIQCLCKSARNIYPFDPPVPPVSGHRSVFFYAKCKGVVTPAHSPKFCNSFLQYCLFCYYLLLRSHWYFLFVIIFLFCFFIKKVVQKNIPEKHKSPLQKFSAEDKSKFIKMSSAL